MSYKSPLTMRNSATEYVSITPKCDFRRLALLNLTKNKAESEIKNKQAPMAVMIPDSPVLHMNLNHAKQFIIPLIIRYNSIG